MAPSDAILERMMTFHPKVIDLTLDRTHRLLAALGNPERCLPPVVHIAGTNGKGSTLCLAFLSCSYHNEVGSPSDNTAEEAR